MTHGRWKGSSCERSLQCSECGPLPLITYHPLRGSPGSGGRASSHRNVQDPPEAVSTCDSEPFTAPDGCAISVCVCVSVFVWVAKCVAKCSEQSTSFTVHVYVHWCMRIHIRSFADYLISHTYSAVNTRGLVLTWLPGNIFLLSHDFYLQALTSHMSYPVSDLPVCRNRLLCINLTSVDELDSVFMASGVFTSPFSSFCCLSSMFMLLTDCKQPELRTCVHTW